MGRLRLRQGLRGFRRLFRLREGRALAAVVIACLAASLACATGEVRPGVVARRGQMVVSGPTFAAVTAGPARVQVYTGSVGASLYAVPADKGTDEDCRPERRLSPAVAILTPVLPDRRTALEVPAGQLACVSTSQPGHLELMWRTRPTR
jgi:hypothetical protein